MGVNDFFFEWEKVGCHSYLANGLLREGMTAISLETLVLLRRKVVHENPMYVVSGWHFGDGQEKWKEERALTHLRLSLDWLCQESWAE